MDSRLSHTVIARVVILFIIVAFQIGLMRQPTGSDMHLNGEIKNCCVLLVLLSWRSHLCPCLVSSAQDDERLSQCGHCQHPAGLQEQSVCSRNPYLPHRQGQSGVCVCDPALPLTRSPFPTLGANPGTFEIEFHGNIKKLCECAPPITKLQLQTTIT